MSINPIIICYQGMSILHSKWIFFTFFSSFIVDYTYQVFILVFTLTPPSTFHSHTYVFYGAKRPIRSTCVSVALWSVRPFEQLARSTCFSTRSRDNFYQIIIDIIKPMYEHADMRR